MSRDTPLAALLFRTHAALVLLSIAAIAVPIAGLLYTRSLVSHITDVEMRNLDAEEAIHRAAWRVEVAARRASRACLVDPHLDPATIVPDIVAADRALDETLARYASRAKSGLLRPARRYHHIIDGIGTDTCQVLGRIAADRLALDEELTDAWIDQLRALHGAISVSERQARRTSAWSSVAALLFGIAGVAGAGLIAQKAARRLGRPLADASATAVRLGRGDFSPVAVASGGVREIAELSEALARMGRDLGALDRMKQQLLASVSHELHTPLAKLREALALLGDGTAGPLTPRQARVVQLARDACEREVRTVTALLDTSRLQTGQALRIQSGVSIDAVIQAAIDEERPDADERRVTVRLALEGEAPSLAVDVALVERTVANLVRNAVSVSPAGSEVEVRRRTDGRSVRIEVIDRGPGLPATLQGDPFRAFQSAAVGERAAGLGLGLPLAREVARAHGGDLVVARTGPEGTCFAFLLPLADVQEGPTP
jgi:two-component system sensor histidine kinase GlrK